MFTRQRGLRGGRGGPAEERRGQRGRRGSIGGLHSAFKSSTSGMRVAGGAPLQLSATCRTLGPVQGC